ncbi:MAG: hypothetical protein CM1200mP15_07990 [Dehalococcoidia bacterium]|nr:MAG: hypothetical protein CM1200mP15_07990 [Dehalococcoidia bacterium]
MPEPEALYEIKDGIAFITLNRPEKLNAIDPPMRPDSLGLVSGRPK